MVKNGAETLALAPLVQQLAVNAYAHPSEQLGVCYSGSSPVPGITEERGLPLYEAVNGQLGKTSFATGLQEDPSRKEFGRQDLLEVGQHFPIGGPQEEEKVILIRCLLPDEPRESEWGRLATNGLLLELADRIGGLPSPKNLFEASMTGNQNLPSIYAGTLDQWLKYLIRDSLAVCHEAVMELVVRDLEARTQADGGANLVQILEAFLQQDDMLEEPLRRLEILPRQTPVLDIPLSTLVDKVTSACRKKISTTPLRWDGPLGEEQLIEMALEGGAGSFTLLLVAWIVARERVQTSDGTAVAGIEQLSQQGKARIGMEQVILPGIERMVSEQTTIRQACYQLAYQAVQQHLSIAWARLALDPRKDVATVSHDGERWYHRQRFQAGRVASRLEQSIGWLRQLQLIGADGLTPDGKRCLERVRVTLEAR
jgi:hypothetical protein